jgi:hypothetical protein
VTGHRYWLAGLGLESEIALPALPVFSGDAKGTDRVTISRASLEGHVVKDAVSFADCTCNGEELLLEIPKITRFLIREGREILVDQHSDATADDVSAYLLGSAFGILCLQRGIVPLHSSTIAIGDDECVAFVGDSGAGKSTLVAALARQGARVISDDVCFLATGPAGDVVAWPGIGRIRLWEDALMALDLSGPDAVRELRGYNKYVLGLKREPELERPRRLSRLYQLKRSGADQHSIQRIRGAAAFNLILHNVYRIDYAEQMGLKPAVFARCIPLARQAAVFEFDRPIGLDKLSEGVELLLRHLAEHS